MLSKGCRNIPAGFLEYSLLGDPWRERSPRSLGGRRGPFPDGRPRSLSHAISRLERHESALSFPFGGRTAGLAHHGCGFTDNLSPPGQTNPVCWKMTRCPPRFLTPPYPLRMRFYSFPGFVMWGKDSKSSLGRSGTSLRSSSCEAGGGIEGTRSQSESGNKSGAGASLLSGLAD